MRKFLIFLSIVLSITSAKAATAKGTLAPVFEVPFGPIHRGHIVSGQQAVRGQFPYQAALVIDSGVFCGGSLIAKNWVLSAAHCVYKFSKWTVTLGAVDRGNRKEPGQITIVTTQAVAHELFDRTTLENDVGVVNLNKEVELNEYINLISLAPRSFAKRDFVGTIVRASGWGKVADGDSPISQYLNFVDLKVISVPQCRFLFGPIVDERRYCCSGDGGRSTCNGDSGGPLTVGSGKNLTQLGIVSFWVANGCASGFPSGYVAVPHYVDWIANKTGVHVQQDEDF